MRAARSSRRLRRGMYLLPSLFTVGNIFCGYVSIVLATTGDAPSPAGASTANYEMAALLILIAALLDALDGRVARVTGTTSEFGLQFDSIADVISFGVAPAVLAFSWSLSAFGRLGWAVSFLFVICGAMRLARFNLQSSHQDRRYFVGMPIPAAACIIATTIYAHPEPPGADTDPFIGGMLLLLVLLVSFLMVSRVKYRSFKELDLKSRRSYKYLLVPAAVLGIAALHPQVVMMVAGFLYLLSGIVPRLGPARHEVLPPGDGRLSAAGGALGKGGDDAR